jgi:hypothetical protein
MFAGGDEIGGRYGRWEFLKNKYNVVLKGIIYCERWSKPYTFLICRFYYYNSNFGCLKHIKEVDLS